MNLVQLSGQPGTGKTFGVQFLNPATTVFIDCDKKGLPWVGWKKQWNKEAQNYFAVDDVTKVAQLIKWVTEKRPEVNCIVVDTINSLMSAKQMSESKKSNFDKWMDLAESIYDIYDYVRSIPREDCVCFFAAHIEAYEADGYTHYRTKTNGKMLTKLNLNSFLNYNLYTEVEHDGDGNNQYKFLTQTSGRNEARSPHGVFKYRIDNNLEEIRARIIESES